jgi:hypothetical protein
MRQEGVDSVDCFTEWLAEETAYLEGLKNAPKTNNDTMEMEYVQKLVNLSASQYVRVLHIFSLLTVLQGKIQSRRCGGQACKGRRGELHPGDVEG